MSGTAYVPAEGKGTIFKNDRKEKDNHPDWKGVAMLDGRMVEIALWTRDGKRGEFYSVGIGHARERQAPQPAREAPPGPSKPSWDAPSRSTPDDSDSIPF